MTEEEQDAYFASLDPERLAQLLSRQPGSRERKIRWIADHLDLIFAEALRSLEGELTRHRLRGAVISTLIRFYKMRRPVPPRLEPLPGGRDEASQDAISGDFLSRADVDAGLAEILRRRTP